MKKKILIALGIGAGALAVAGGIYAIVKRKKEMALLEDDWFDDYCTCGCHKDKKVHKEDCKCEDGCSCEDDGCTCGDECFCEEE